MQHRPLLASALALALAAACSDSGHSGHAGHSDHADHSDPTGADVHGQDDRGFVFLDPQHPAHPNWADLGDIELGDTAHTTVRMRNVEDHPITIDTVLSGCSCTAPEISAVTESGERIVGNARASSKALVVPPGATVELALSVDSRLSPARNKDKLVLVRLTTDDEHDPYLSIELRMKVVSAFQSAPPELDLQRVARNGGAMGTVEIAAIGESGRRLIEVLETPPELGATLLEGREMGLSPLWTLHVTLRAPLPLGPQERVLRLSTSHESGIGEGRPFEVKVRWNAVEDVEVVPPRILFLADPALGREVGRVELFSRLAGARLRIVQASVAGPSTDGLEVTFEPALTELDSEGKASRWRVTVDPRGRTGPIDGTLTILTDDPTVPRFDVPMLRRR